MKKSSAKARRQRDDRAYAEFEAMMRRLAKASKRDVDAGQVQPIPPAASTGIGAAASTTAGTSASVDTNPVWPPASVP